MEAVRTLVLAVIEPDDGGALLAALSARGCRATYLTARRGLLSRHHLAVLTLVSPAAVPAVIQALRATCARRTVLVTPVAEADLGFVPSPIEAEIGGAVVYGLSAAAIPLTTNQRSQVAGAGAEPETDLSVEMEAEMLERTPMKLVVAIMPDRIAERAAEVLRERQVGVTTIGSTGGFLRRGNTTILAGVEAERAEEIGRLMATVAHVEEPDELGRGVAFALPVEWRIRF